jgi:prepilin-type N-terminal cleavage/methylation domain-containing protein
MKQTHQRGLSILELLTVLAIMAVVATAALPRIESALRESRVQTALVNVVVEMRRARQLAMDQRRIHSVTFTSPRTLTITRIETGGNPNVQLSQITLPSDVSFTRNSISSEPDGFSTSGAFTFCGSGGSFNFTPQGAGVDGSNSLCNGVVYIGIPGRLETTRAVTLFGSTGRSKGFRYTQSGAMWSWK